MINIPAGKILVVTAADAVSSGAVWFAKSGAQLVRAATVSTTPVYLGPYQDDAQVEVIMDAGYYSYSFDGAGLQVPVLLLNEPKIYTCTANKSATSNTTLDDIPGMITATLDVGTYLVESIIKSNVLGNGGLKISFKQSVASMLTSVDIIGAYTTNTGAFFGSELVVTTDQASIISIANALSRYVSFSGVIVVANAGTLSLQMAQALSNVTFSQVQKGSFMKFTRIS